MFFNNKDEIQEVRLEVPQQKLTTSTKTNRGVSLSTAEPNNKYRFQLTLILEGDVEKLIVCDEGEVPVFHEFDNLKNGWFEKLVFLNHSGVTPLTWRTCLSQWMGEI